MSKRRITSLSLLSISLVFILPQHFVFAAQDSKPTPKSTPSKASPSKPVENPSKAQSTPEAKKPIENSKPAATATAEKSSNAKLNPSTLNSSKINGNAQKKANVESKVSAACQAKTSAEKAKLAADPCSDFIVVFAPGLARTKSRDLLKQSNAQTKSEFSNIFNGALITAPLSKALALVNNPNVLVVEDDLQVTSTAIQTQAPWGLDRIDQVTLPLSSTFDDADISGVNSYAFVVDTGIDAENVEFTGRVASGFTAIDDGLGSKDCNGHGTHVAGIIGSKTYGVAKSTTLIPVRVLDCSGSGTYSSVIAGLDWIAANYTTGTSAVVNMSLGGPASSTLDGAVTTLISKGINVVVAAGNSNTDACTSSPARVADALTIAATDLNDNRAGYSNYGTCVDLFAPGSAITSTWLGTTGTNTISGTSMASPNVAGIVARFISANPGLTPQQVSNSIKSSSSKNVVIGAGTGTLNQLANVNVIPDLTTTSPSPTPKFTKVIPRGKKSK